MARNYYDALGIPRWATSREIEVAFHDRTELMRVVRAQEAALSPDEAGRSEGTLEEHYNEIKEAYDVLSNPGKRKQYDAFLQRVQPPCAGELQSRSRLLREKMWGFAWAGVVFLTLCLLASSFFTGRPSHSKLAVILVFSVLALVRGGGFLFNPDGSFSRVFLLFVFFFVAILLYLLATLSRFSPRT